MLLELATRKMWMWFFCWVLPKIGEALFVPDRVPPMQKSSFLVSRKRHSMSTVYAFRLGLLKRRFQPGMLIFEHGRRRRPGRFVAVAVHCAFPQGRHNAQQLQQCSMYYAFTPRRRNVSFAFLSNSCPLSSSPSRLRSR